MINLLNPGVCLNIRNTMDSKAYIVHSLRRLQSTSDLSRVQTNQVPHILSKHMPLHISYGWVYSVSTPVGWLHVRFNPKD